jgi:hypothetical protein
MITDVDLIAEPEEIQTTDEAFMSAITPKEINGIKLQPYSLMRQVIAMELTGIDSSPFFNAVVRSWVCTLTDEQAIQARADRTKATVEAFAWAEAQGFSFANYQPLLDVYEKLNTEIEHSSNAVDPEQRDDEKNSGGPQV